MSYKTTPYPKFCWSYSRHKMLNQCSRKYYYQYYGGHNGWLNNIDPEIKHIWRLKKLTGFHLILGNEIHKMIARSLENNSKIVPEQDLSKIKSRLDNAYKQSNKKEYLWWDQPKNHIMLQEVYYKQNISAEIFNRLEVIAHNCLKNILKSKSYHETKKNGYIQIAQDFGHFFLDEIKIFATPDLIYKDTNDNIIIVDWKTGNFNPEEDKKQLFIYAYYYLTHFNDSKPVNIRLEYLKEGSYVQEAINPSVKDKIEQKIWSSIDDMNEYLLDVEANKPKTKDEFWKRETRLCNFCKYQELC